MKDKEGRLSHHKRAGWTEPWKAAWINLQAMFVYGADFFVLKPGLILLGLGLLLTLPLSLGPLTIGSVTLSLYWMLAGVTLTVLGFQNFYLGCLAQVLYDSTGEATARWTRLFPYNRTVALSAVAFLLGIALVAPLVVEYVREGLALPSELGAVNHLAVLGIMLVILSFATFTFTLLLHALAQVSAERRELGAV